MWRISILMAYINFRFVGSCATSTVINQATERSSLSIFVYFLVRDSFKPWSYSYVLCLSEGRLKGESLILSTFHSSNSLSFMGHFLKKLCLMAKGCMLKFFYLPGHIFHLLTLSFWNKVSWPWQLDLMAPPCSSFGNCTALGKNFGVLPLVTLIEKSSWKVDPGEHR